MPEGCSTEQQPMGVGSTSYFFVDSIEEVCFCILKQVWKYIET
jgi:hypothetical protein